MRHEELRETLQRVLEGREQLRIEEEGFVPAAVLLLLYPRDGAYHIILTQRTSRVEHHKGEVSLPGGAWDHGETLAETALREAREEVGLDTSQVELLGALDQLATRSNFVVTPYVAVTTATPRFARNEREVADLLEIPVHAFFDPTNYTDVGETEFAGRVVPGGYFRWGEAIIFGATYRILRQFLDLIEPMRFWRASTIGAP